MAFLGLALVAKIYVFFNKREMRMQMYAEKFSALSCILHFPAPKLKT
jgi:hypothetical protein